jgi:hypothetical protein
MVTTYSIHRAYDHSIAVTASGVNLQSRAQALAEDVANHGHRFYVHNGKGVVAAMLVKPHGALDILRDDYRKFDAKARAVRANANLSND